MSDDIIWISVSGGVRGINLTYLNNKIDQFNRSEYLVNHASFWEWFSWEEGEEYRGLSYLQQDTSKIHLIKRRNVHE